MILLRIAEIKNLNQKPHFSEIVTQKHPLEKKWERFTFRRCSFLIPIHSAFLPKNDQKRGIFGGLSPEIGK